MTNNKRGFISKTVGLSLGFLGIVGLVISLVSLLPVNLYNIFITVNALTELLKYELEDNKDWWTLSPTGTVYSVFLTGSIVSSLIVAILVLATCFRQGMHRSAPPSSQESTGVATATTAATPGPSKASDLESKQAQGKRTSLWTSRMGILIFVGQIGWALFGTHLLFFMDAPALPGTVRKSTMISVLILWINYLIITVFSFILFCASFFIILGARPHRSRRRHRNTSYTPSSSSSGEEMQYHREETTPLLINMS